jgi:ACT domain-containing protein
MIPKAVGRPNKVDMRVVIKLADMIQHNATISEATKYAGISRETYYRYFNNNSYFRNTMIIAKENQNKAVMSFLTVL